MLDKQTKRELRKTRKVIGIFLAICIPVMIAFTCLLYYLVPSLVNHQWVPILLIVVLGLLLFFGVTLIIKKVDKKKASKPKKYDPFSD